LQSERDLLDVVTGVDDRERAGRANVLGEVLPRDVLHRQDEYVLRLHAGVRGDDVRVLQSGRVPDLLQEALDGPRAVDQFFVDDLQDLGPVHQQVVGEVHLAHPALAETALDPIVRQPGER
jgi:hypothetical protein